MGPKQIKAKIISNKIFRDNYWHLELESKAIAGCAVPGQFVNIKVSDGIEPLLRRPLSIHGIEGSRVRFFYEALGPGTRLLSGRNPGEFLDVIGPLGNGFVVPGKAKAARLKVPVLVAGGMGVAPLIFLAKEIRSSKPLVLIGARTKSKILCAQEFKALGCAVKIATDDGSSGFKGRVTELLGQVLRQDAPGCARRLAIYACGPRPMLKAVAGIACENDIDSRLSLEEHMACGIGACLGCVIATKSGYKKVCKDGPVFSGKELTW
ncbi:dihydroorotate dehydrogenase electron transfer subunit [bacterium]|nr:MAG: dihydroorotate dehydrogenase electron transfer subunit [bacterium]